MIRQEDHQSESKTSGEPYRNRGVDIRSRSAHDKVIIAVNQNAYAAACFGSD